MIMNARLWKLHCFVIIVKMKGKLNKNVLGYIMLKRRGIHLCCGCKLGWAPGAEVQVLGFAGAGPIWHTDKGVIGSDWVPVLPKAKRGAQHGLDLGPWPWPGAARSPHRAPGTGQGHVGPAASWSGLKAKSWCSWGEASPLAWSWNLSALYKLIELRALQVNKDVINFCCISSNGFKRKLKSDVLN